MRQTFDNTRLSSVIGRSDTIVLIGSGVSAWSGMPTWYGLLEHLCDFLESINRSADLVRRELQNNDLLLAASFGFDQLSPQERRQFLRAQFLKPNAEPSPLHRAIAALGSRCFITTNYDTLLEQTLRTERPSEYFDIVTPLQQIEVAAIVQARAEGFIFKPHGDIGSSDSVVITREDYRAFHGERRNVLEATRTLLVSRPTMYIGFGLRDPDFLLIQDLLSTTFGPQSLDHYALMPDVAPAEADYWLRNYGIRLVSYQTDSTQTGLHRHHALLTLIQGLAAGQDNDASIERSDSTGNQVLALARHARRLISEIPEAADPMPLLLEMSRIKQEIPESIAYRLRGRNALSALTSCETSLVLEGAPGAGKSYTVEQAVRRIAQRLEERCLTSSCDRPEDLRVPVVVQFRDYQGDVASMVAQALPFDLQIEQVYAWGNGIFVLDGINEAPANFQADHILSDLATFLGMASHCTTIITTRFGIELKSLGLPTLSLDEISFKYIEAQIAKSNDAGKIFDDETVSLLRRPLYFNAWRRGWLDFSTVTTAHDVYQQLVGRLENDAKSQFGDLHFGDVFGKLAYRMIESGTLSVSVGEVHAELRAALPRDVNIASFVDYQISAGTLLATARRRLAFFHHSVTEYFAARYLARLVTVDPGAIRRCLNKKDWDQALLLTLGFLHEDQASAVFEEVIKADPVMALRSLKYVETQRTEWTNRALSFLASQELDRWNTQLWSELSRTRVTSDNQLPLKELTKHGESLGGAAAALLWEVAPPERGNLLRLLLDTSKDFNFQARLSEGICKLTDSGAVNSLLTEISSLELDPDVEELLRAGEEVEHLVGLIHSVATILSSLPFSERVSAARRGPVLVCRAVVESLRHTRTPDAIIFMQEQILGGNDFAIVGLYFQLEFGEPRDEHLPSLLPELVPTLFGAISEGRQPEWALATLHRLVHSFPEIISTVWAMAPVDGLMRAFAAYIAGDEALFFSILDSLVGTKFNWSNHPVEALGHVKVQWSLHTDLLVNLLREQYSKLTVALIDSLHLSPYRDAQLSIEIDNLGWWIDWIRRLDPHDDYFARHRLGEFLARATDKSTRAELIKRFNEVDDDRSILAVYVLPRVTSISVDDLYTDAVQWLLADIQSRDVKGLWNEPLLAKLASEDFVQTRLIPMLMDAPEGQLRHNLLVVLKRAGIRHRRRYVDSNGELIA